MTAVPATYETLLGMFVMAVFVFAIADALLTEFR